MTHEKSFNSKVDMDKLCLGEVVALFSSTGLIGDEENTLDVLVALHSGFRSWRGLKPLLRMVLPNMSLESSIRKCLLDA